MKRRPKGSGTIRQTSEGTFRALFAFAAGRREDIDGSPFASYDLASAALDGILAELRNAGAVQGGMTLKRLGERALDQREKEGYRAIDSDRNIWSAHIARWDLFNAPARAITRGDVREHMANLRNRKTRKALATQTRRNVLNMLRMVFAFGVDDGTLDANPCADVRIKSSGSTRETSTYLTLAEATALLTHATDPAVGMAIGGGFRSGELRSLLWSDVHLDGVSPHVVVRYGKPDEPTKNGKIRTVPLFGVALASFKRAATAKEEDARIVLPSLSGWYRQKGRVVEPEQWKAWKTAAGITRPVRWHDLRHTCATLLLTGAWGGPPWSYEAVKDMLGHSSVKVTERYARSASLASQAALAMAPKARRGRKDKGGIGAAGEGPEVAQAREIVERCRWDLNPHMPVLQTGA